MKSHHFCIWLEDTISHVPNPAPGKSTVSVFYSKYAVSKKKNAISDMSIQKTSIILRYVIFLV